jgi:hypothetical protein
MFGLPKEPKRKRAIAYYEAGRRVMTRETLGWSSPAHWLGRGRYVCRGTWVLRSYLVDVFVRG